MAKKLERRCKRGCWRATARLLAVTANLLAAAMGDSREQAGAQSQAFSGRARDLLKTLQLRESGASKLRARRLRVVLGLKLSYIARLDPYSAPPRFLALAVCLELWCRPLGC